MSRKDNSNVKYIDVDLQLDEELISMYDQYSSASSILPGNSKLSSYFDGARETETSAQALPDDQNVAGTYYTTINKYLIRDNCTKTKSTSGGYGVGSSTTWSSTWLIGSSLHHFDTSSITDTVTNASFKFYGKYENLSTGAVTGDAIDLRPLTMIALKSSSVQNPTEGTNNTSNNTYTTNDWNGFDGWTSNWDSSDVTEYGTSCDMKQGTNNVWGYMEYDTFNSAFYTDVQNNNDVYIYFMDKDLMYDDDFAITEGLGQDSTNSSSGKRNVYCNGNDHTTTAYRPYLEVTAGTVATPTENAVFFGTNF